MPLIEEISDSEEQRPSPLPLAPSPPRPRVQMNLSDIPSIPSTFAQRDPALNYSDPEDPISAPDLDLEKWKEDAKRTLEEVRDLFRSIREKKGDEGGEKGMSTEEEASAVYYAAQFDGTQAWVSEESIVFARDILAFQTPPPTPLLHTILSTRIRPLFLAHPHPNLNPSTGRKLPPQPSGLYTDYYYEEQTWKEHPGVGNVLRWCVRNMQAEQYESLWPLLLPPLMAFLDDYQLAYRIEGTRIVDAFLDTVPPELLKRTGVGELIYNAMSKSTQLLSDPLTPSLLSTTIPALLRLIALTTTTSSSSTTHTSSLAKATPPETERFSKLCKLLGEHIIGHVWVYASEDVDVMCATTEALPGVLGALGVGSVRYLKALIPQLLHTLNTSPPSTSLSNLRALQLSTLVALQATIRTCAPRIPRWRETILSGIARAWVGLCDSDTLLGESKMKAEGERERERQEVKEELVKTCLVLKEVCEREGGGVKTEYERLLRMDAGMFGELLGQDLGVQTSVAA